MAEQRRATVATTAVLFAALGGVTAVWLLSAWWSFAEQTRAAAARGFEHPAVLPWTLDGLAVSLALVALAAALDGRPAPLARVGVLVALAGSVWANRLGVELRHGGDYADQLASVAPLSAFAAFEVILAALRRLVLRWRGLPAPVPVPALRPVRLLLAPIASVREWRAAVLAVTAPSLSAGPATPPGRAGGHHLDGPALAGRQSVRPAPSSVSADAAPGGRPGGRSGPSTPQSVDESTRPGVDGPGDSAVDAGPDSGGRVDASPVEVRVDSGPDADRTPRRGVHRGRAGLPGGRRTGRPAGHSPDRTVPDWREVDWAAIAVDRGVKRARAFEIIKSEPGAVDAARERLRAMNGSAP